MFGLDKFSKTVPAVLVCAAVAACNGSVQSDSGFVSFDDDRNGNGSSGDSSAGITVTGVNAVSDAGAFQDLSSYGSPAVKTDLFSSYIGTTGENLPDPDLPQYDSVIYFNLTDLLLSADDYTYSPLGSGITAAGDGIDVSVTADGRLLIDASACARNVKYVLTGTVARGGVKIITAPNAVFGLELNGADITGGGYPAVSISPETSTAFVELQGMNYLTDGRVFGVGYSGSNGSVYYDADADGSVDVSRARETEKWALGSDEGGAFSSEGSIRFSGDGILNVSTSYKHGIYAKNRIMIFGGMIGVHTDGRNGMQSRNGFDMFGGTVNIAGKGTHTNKQSEGIVVTGDESNSGAGLGGVNVEGGALIINTVGSAVRAKWNAEKDAGTEDSSDDPNPVVRISGGYIDINTLGEVTVKHENSRTFTYRDENGVSVTEKESCHPEGIEGRQAVLISGGEISIRSTDDGLNASRTGKASVEISGGLVYVNSSSGDAIDSNGDITVSGGLLVSETSSIRDQAFDCDGILTFTGGLAVGISRSDRIYAGTGASATTQNTFVLEPKLAGEGNTVMAINDAYGKTVFAYAIPEGPYANITLTSPTIADAGDYSVYSGVTATGGSAYKGLYFEMPEVTGGILTETVNTGDSVHVYNLSGGSNVNEHGN